MFPSHKKSFCGLLVILTISICTQSLGARGYYTPNYRSSPDSLSRVLKVGGLSALGALALYGLYKWWKGMSNDELLQKAQRACDSAHRDYEGRLAFLEDFNPGHHVDQVNEQGLYQLAGWLKNQSVSTAQSLLNGTIDDLTWCKKTMDTRLRKMKYNDPLHYDMQAALKSINPLLRRLKFFYSYVQHHLSYFSLLEAEGKLRAHYRDELGILERHHSISTCNDEIDRAIMIRKARATYPHAEYARELEQEIAMLDWLINRLAYAYHDRIGAAQAMLAQLRGINNIVVTHPSYRVELRRQEEARITQERLALKKREAIARERVATAKEREVKVLEDRAREDEIRRLRKQLDLALARR